MDALDVSLIRELIQEDVSSPMTTDPFRSLRTIAGRLKVDKETVRKRIQNLHDRDFLRPSGVMINPILVGLRMDHMWVDGLTRPRKREMIPKIREVPEILLITDYLGDSVNLLGFRAEEEGKTGLTDRLPLVHGVSDVISTEMAFPPCDLELSPLDWRIVDGLSVPQASHAALASAVGLSAKTVRRRLDRMIRERALFVIPSFRLDALDSNPADLTLFYGDTAAKGAVDQEVLTKLSDHLIRAELHNVNHSFFNLMMDNVARGRGIVDWVESRPGVTAARLDFIQERIEMIDHMQAIVDERVGTLSLDGGKRQT